MVASAGPGAGVTAAASLAARGTGALNGLLLNRVSPPGGEADLPVGGGDLIEISVFEVAELSSLKVRIPLRGTITLPLLGSIPAAGRTAIELEDDIRQRLRQRYMHDPQVSVFVHEHKSQRISVIGAVRVGGVFTITTRLRLADALALAQGLTDDADHVIYLIRRLPAGTMMRAQAGTPLERPAGPPVPGAPTEEVMVPIDLDALVQGNEELNVALESGDVLNVPRAGSYYVGGSVERPGPFLLRARTTVAQAVMAAGGVRDDADWSDVRVYRPKPGGGQEVLAFSLNDFEAGKEAPEVQKNDVVMVGRSLGKAFFFGTLNVLKGVFGFSKPL
jgi:polysaccharide export outer membrane protein